MGRVIGESRMTGFGGRPWLAAAGLLAALFTGGLVPAAGSAGAAGSAPAAGGATTTGSVPAAGSAGAAETRAPARAGALRGFVRDIEYILLVDGVQVPVELYKGESAGAVVMVSPSFREPLLLRAGALAAVDPAKVEKRPDATLDLAADAVLTPRGSFEVTADGVSFTLDGHRVSVRHLDAPPLLGPRRLAEVTAHNPEYLASAAAYAPSQPAIATLQRERRAVTVRVYYGSWCGHCRMLVPHAVKVEQLLAGSRIRFEYFGLRNPQTDPEAQKAGVSVIPTGVVTVGGRELARIVSDADWQALETALAGVLAGRRAAGGAGRP
jgi:thiol-disulfide isomerase/thioredoxin